MPPRVRTKIEALAGSAMLMVAARVFMALTPMPIAWAGVQLIDVRERVGKLEAAREQARQDFTRRLETLEAHDRDDTKATTQIQVDLATMRGDIRFTRELLERIEKTLNSRR